MRLPVNWPKLVFVFVPVLIAGADAVVLVRERVQPPAQQAISLVKESNSRTENFNVQQYLYTTIYHRRDQGEEISVGDWRARSQSGKNSPITVEFSYSDSSEEHAAQWQVQLKDGKVVAKNELALNLSWH